MNRSGDWEELLQGCLNGTLDEEQESRLARLLQESSEARQTLRSYLRLEGGLLTLARAGELGGDMPAPDGGAIAPLDVTPAVQSLSDQPSPPHKRYWRLAVAPALLAAVVLLAIGAIRWLVPPPPPPSSSPLLGQVIEVEGDVEIVSPGGEARPAEVKQPLRAGDLLRTGEGNSIAVLELADRTRLDLSPETAIRLPEDGADGVQLLAGVVRGQEGEQGRRPPLVVTTPAARVHVEGDRFTLSSVSPESLRIDTEGGQAEVVRRRDHRSLTAPAGAAIFVQAEVDDMVVSPMPRLVSEPRRVLDSPGAWAVFFEPDGQHLLAASYREIRRYGPEPGGERTQLSTDTSHGRLAAFSRDGGILAVYRGLRKDDPVLLWDVRHKQQRVRVNARITDQRLALAPDASWLATIDSKESPPACHVWDGKTGSERFTVPATLRVNCVAAAPDSKHLALGLVAFGRQELNHIVVIDARTGEQSASLPCRAGPLTALVFSPDGRYLAAGITGWVQLWDVRKGELVRTIRGFERVLMTLAFSSDGALLAGGTQDGQVWLWDAGSGEEVQLIRAGTSGVRLLTFSPDGRSLVTGGIKRHPLMLWDVMMRQGRSSKEQIPDKS